MDKIYLTYAIYDAGNNSYYLEASYKDTELKTEVNASDHEQASIDEWYFEDQSLLENIFKDAIVEVDARAIDNITRETVEQYLKDYPFTISTTMDPIFKRFKSDVYSLAEEVRKNEAYIYDIKDLIAQIKDIYASELNDWQTNLNELQEALNDGYRVVIDRYGDYTFL